MATARKDQLGEEWRLGIELGDDHQDDLAGAPEQPSRNLSRERLERPLQVVTAEHLGWLAIAVYAVLTRLLALGARPLDSVEARHALYEFDFAGTVTSAAAGMPPVTGGWVHLLTVGIFAVGGADDFTARLICAMSGLLMVSMAFELRHYIGRAGGLALGAMLAMSPTATWYSRSNTMAAPAAAMALVTIALFMALKSLPGRRRAAALGVFAGLMAAADPAGLANAALMTAALAPLGLWDLMTRKGTLFGGRVWLDRYGSLVAIVIGTTAAVWMLSQMMIPGGISGAAVSRIIAQVCGAGRPNLLAGIRSSWPLLALYEFGVVLAAIVGVIAIASASVRSRFAVWALIWAVLSIGYFCWTSDRDSSPLLAVLTPAAIVGAIGIDWLHHREAWRRLRGLLVVIAAATVYVAIVANFVADTPDASEAPWARHGNLFWNAAATTEQARLYARQAAAGIPPVSATVSFESDSPVALRWYLRGLRPIDNAEAATVVVTKASPAVTGTPPVAVYHFDYAERWVPNFAAARAGDLLRFLLSGRSWGPVATEDSTIIVRKAATSAPTVILTPGGG